MKEDRIHCAERPAISRHEMSAGIGQKRQ